MWDFPRQQDLQTNEILFTSVGILHKFRTQCTILLEGCPNRACHKPKLTELLFKQEAVKLEGETSVEHIELFEDLFKRIGSVELE